MYEKEERWGWLIVLATVILGYLVVAGAIACWG